VIRSKKSLILFILLIVLVKLPRMSILECIMYIEASPIQSKIPTAYQGHGEKLTVDIVNFLGTGQSW
jgi:hypothetical protein